MTSSFNLHKCTVIVANTLQLAFSFSLQHSMKTTKITTILMSLQPTRRVIGSESTAKTILPPIFLANLITEDTFGSLLF